LIFVLNSDRRGAIDIIQPFSGDVFGFKIGDPISSAITIFGGEYDSFEMGEFNINIVTCYSWKNKLPSWFFYAIDDRIVGFGFFDKSIYGEWVPR
jgi:hypothetical protein